MNRRLGPELLIKIIKYAIIVGVIAYVAVFLALAYKRLRYPYELEWMEGGMVDHIQWILSGRQLYVKPSLDFIPFTYTPFFFYLSAFFARIVGTGFISIRLVAILSTLGCFGMIFELVRRETKSIFFGLVSVGLFAATYRISGSWFDVGRVDMLFLLLALLSFYVLRFHDSYNSLIISGLLISLAFLTKQTALFIGIAMCVYCLLYLRGWKKIVYPATFAAVLGISTLLLNAVSGGWYTYYIFTLPRAHRIIDSQILSFWVPGISVLLIAFTISLAYLIYLFFCRDRRDFGFYLFFLASLVLASWLISIVAGSFLNDFIPAYAAIAICMGMGAHALSSNVVDGVASGTAAAEDAAGAGASALVEGRSPTNNGGGTTTRGFVQICFVLLACLLQLTSLYYQPRADLPTGEDKYAGDSIVQLIRDTKGEVFVPGHGYLTTLAGKKQYAHGIAIGDVLYAGDEISRNFQRELDDAVKNKQFGGFIFDAPWDSDFGNEQDARKVYSEKIDIFPDQKVFLPVTGFKTRPMVMYRLPD